MRRDRDLDLINDGIITLQKQINTLEMHLAQAEAGADPVPEIGQAHLALEALRAKRTEALLRREDHLRRVFLA